VPAPPRVVQGADPTPQEERDLRAALESLNDAVRRADAAAAGDVARTGQALDALVQQHDVAANFYADPDLGPALRSAPFAPLRQKYPEPPPSNDPD
jgi:hypothetical protein